MKDILLISNKKDKKFLRRKTADFDFKKFSGDEVRELVNEMRETMRVSDGVGLAANQIGLDMRVFVAEVDGKFYAIFNPEIVKSSEETVDIEEGCLSVPGEAGVVVRPLEVLLKGFDRNGKRVKINAWGALARVFQHEVDHLNGKIFTDRINH